MHSGLRRLFLFTIVFVFFIWSAIFIKKVFFTPKPLNLILISVDTLRADHMGIYGYSKNTTPSIDKWAKHANVFTNLASNLKNRLFRYLSGYGLPKPLYSTPKLKEIENQNINSVIENLKSLGY